MPIYTRLSSINTLLVSSPEHSLSQASITRAEEIAESSKKLWVYHIIVWRGLALLLIYKHDYYYLLAPSPTMTTIYQHFNPIPRLV